MKIRVPERQVGWADDVTLYYDDAVLVTWHDAWTAVRLPLVPYAFRARQERLDLGARSTLALAALGSGDVRLAVVRRPYSPDEWARRTAEHVGRVGAPSSHWPAVLGQQAARMAQVQASDKHVILWRRLGTRNAAAQWNSRLARGPVPVVAAGEVAHWHKEAARVRALLARGPWGAVPVDGVDVRWLRRHALVRGLGGAGATATGRRAWHRRDVADEFGDVTLTPMARGVRVDSAQGTAYTATLVASAFPVEMSHPETPPWLAHLDRVGSWAEAEVVARLVPPARAKRDVVQRLRLAQDQRSDAASSGADLPLETEDMHGLARRMERDIPGLRKPLVYGWARFRVDADSEEELAYRVGLLQEAYSSEDSPHIDLALPTGMAQVDLLVEGVPGQRPAHKSWQQRWTCDTVACGLPQAGSNLGHGTGMYVGPTTGRYLQAVTLDPHHSITRRTAADVEGPGGMVLLGAQRSGKSSAFARMIDDATARGYTSVVQDFSGPLARLADLERNRGRIQVLDLVKVGGGVLDPMGNAVIPGDSVHDRVVREARKHLTRSTLHLLAHRQLAASPDAESEMLRAITAVAEERHPSLRAVLERLARSTNTEAQALAEHLRFELGGQDADALYGEGGDVDYAEPVTRIITAPGMPLPAPGQPMAEWMPAQAVGAAMFGVASHLARRLLWDLPSHHLKYFMVDEAHIAMGTAAGRKVIEEALRDGPKHGVVVALATHNAVDLSDERIINALATKMLFRSTSDTELERSHRVAGIEDTEAVRRQRRGLRNGECIMVLDTGVRDRVQWDTGWDRDLQAASNTTPTGER